jgi:uncharacterized membrane protein
MTSPPRVLLAGESWISQSTHLKGWDFSRAPITRSVVSILNVRS